ncbi:MAG: protein O-mannosyl-transferase family [Elusimicrobiota bacterium]
MKKVFYLFLFLFFAGIYIYSAAPQLAPYRDAGEMVSVFHTFGVAHPPGYPTYTILGQLTRFFLIGNVAYQSNVFSGVAGALALLLLFLFLENQFNFLSALFSVLMFGLSNPFWELCSVSEMYSLGVLLVCAFFYISFVLKDTRLLAFIFGLALGVRMDLLLMIPVFLFVLKDKFKAMGWDKALLFFVLGGSVYLYLLLRSLKNPLLDWGNPETILGLFNSVSRHSYGGTLDLLSLSYKKGENWGINLLIYGQHLIHHFGIVFCLLSILGIFIQFFYFKKYPTLLLALLIFVVSGPFFFLLANMPPNPHSLAIVEASYLIPDLCLALFVAAGLHVVFKTISGRKPLVVCFIIIFFSLTVAQASQQWDRGSKRNNFYAVDYVENLLKSIPMNSIAVLQKDVQLFSVWQAQLIQKKRPDVQFISVGLSGSLWYWDMMSRWPNYQNYESNLKSIDGWNDLKSKAGNKALFVSGDVDASLLSQLSLSPQGLLMKVSNNPPNESPPLELLMSLFVYRGRYSYGQTPDFFSTDLIGDHARAFHRLGYSFLSRGQWDESIPFYRAALNMDSTFPAAVSDLGFIYFQKGEFEKSLSFYELALARYQFQKKLTIKYKSLPELVRGTDLDLANAYIQIGATYEKLGNKIKARENYSNSFSVMPLAQAYFNMAVTYWNENWDLVIQNLDRAVQLNPRMEEARKYGIVARMKRNS